MQFYLNIVADLNQKFMIFIFYLFIFILHIYLCVPLSFF